MIDDTDAFADFAGGAGGRVAAAAASDDEVIKMLWLHGFGFRNETLAAILKHSTRIITSEKPRLRSPGGLPQGWADGRMGGWADGRMGGWADGRMGG